MKSFHRRISDGFRMFWKMPVDSVKQMLEFTQGSVDNPAGAVLWLTISARVSEVFWHLQCAQPPGTSRDGLR